MVSYEDQIYDVCCLGVSCPAVMLICNGQIFNAKVTNKLNNERLSVSPID